jgi:N-methylhydantoinase A
MAMARIGVDVGGTFTDLVLEKTDKNDCAKVFVHKVASTPHDQSVGVLRGVLEFAS